jgi:hypothetical protein
MNLLVPAALAFGLIIPIILLFYFMRPKRQERVIGSTLLWQQAMQELQASRPWQRLRLTPLLLLQLIAAIVIVLVLTRPAIFSNSPVSGDTIVILQASASMRATDVAPNRFEAAKNNIANFINDLGPNDRLSLITMALTPRVLIAEAQDKGQLTNALHRAQVTNQDADLTQALSLALSLAQGHAHAQILVVGDGHVTNADQKITLPVPVRFLPIGTNAPNTAILAFDSRTLQGKLIAFAQVANYSRQQRAIPIELYADSHLVSVQTVTLGPDERGTVQWGPLAANTRFLHARLVTQDALTADHEAWAIVGGSMRGRVLLVTKGNRFLEVAFGRQANVNLSEITPDHYANLGTYDLTIFDGFVPPVLPPGNILFVNPPQGKYLFGQSGQEIGVNHITSGQDAHNLLTDVDLSSIHVLRASHRLTATSWLQSVIQTPQTPLLLVGENNNQRIAVLSFDLHNSDLPLQPAFPILIRNMTNWFLPAPVPGNGQESAGSLVAVQTWPGANHITITGPDQRATTVGPPFPVAPFASTDQIGIYQVTQRVRGQDLQGAFVVNLFNPEQSRLAPASSLPVVNSTTFTDNGNGVSHQLREIWPWIAAFLLLVLCFEWWLFSRSYQARTTQSTEQRRSLGTVRVSTPKKNSLLTQWQNQLQTQYKETRKRVVKATKRTRNKLKRRSTKEEKRVNI